MFQRCWLIRMPPNVDQTDRRMETIEHNQRQRDMIENIPQNVTIEFVSANVFRNSNHQ